MTEFIPKRFDSYMPSAHEVFAFEQRQKAAASAARAALMAAQFALKIASEELPPRTWYCLECGEDMGPGNPRQLCGKWQCDALPLASLFDASSTDDDEEACLGCETGCDATSPHQVYDEKLGEWVFHPTCSTRAAVAARGETNYW